MDLNLLLALDALLIECSVTGAARRLGLSPSAMSRTLTRLRIATGDQLLVRAGRGLVPTPRAAQLRPQVDALTRDVRQVLSPQAVAFDPASLQRTFTIRANDAFIDLFAVRLLDLISAAAPLVCLRFAGKSDKFARALREGLVDLDIGVIGEFAPEIRITTLFRDTFVGVVRNAHPLLNGPLTAQRFAACQHVVTARKFTSRGPIDEALQQLGLNRQIVAMVPSFSAAVRIARRSDLVALVPSASLDDTLADGIASFKLPFATEAIQVSAMWHPRVEADPAHRWLRESVISVCRDVHLPDNVANCAD